MILWYVHQVGEALFVAAFLGVVGGISMFCFSENVAEFLVGLPPGSEISADASAYIRCCFDFQQILLALVRKNARPHVETDI